jgi:hypothetical protein
VLPIRLCSFSGWVATLRMNFAVFAFAFVPSLLTVAALAGEIPQESTGKVELGVQVQDIVSEMEKRTSKDAKVVAPGREEQLRVKPGELTVDEDGLHQSSTILPNDGRLSVDEIDHRNIDVTAESLDLAVKPTEPGQVGVAPITVQANEEQGSSRPSSDASTDASADKGALWNSAWALAACVLFAGSLLWLFSNRLRRVFYQNG